VHVEASLTEEKTITGWMQGKGLVQASTPNGDKILFGEAVDSEDQASRRHGRAGAAQDAMRLYYRTSEYFPTSPLAGEAMYRSADIRWQIEKEDVMSRPSAREKEAFLREGMNEDFMKEVMKKFPGTKWADLAAFHLIDNKLCGEWQASSKCPEKEAEIYEKYSSEHPQSPALAEALYDAAWRRSALIEIYKTETQPKKSDESRSRAIALAQRAVTQAPQSDWGTRAQRLLFMIDRGIPTYGNSE
jgi:outer membrane protein assembly factor BamD (BamD/ComL family)